MVTLLLGLIDPQPPSRLWALGHTPSRAEQDAANVMLRALMLFAPLACY
jgi:hypothetical protein